MREREKKKYSVFVSACVPLNATKSDSQSMKESNNQPTTTVELSQKTEQIRTEKVRLSGFFVVMLLL